MDGAHVHLLVNHVPILGFFLSSLFLLLALVGREREGWMRAALVTLALAFLGGVVAFVTGTPALTAIDGMPRTSGKALTEHHVRAVIAAVVGTIAIIVGFAITLLARKYGAYSSRGVLILLGSNLAAAATLGWTGLAGGRINHPEVQQAADREHGTARPH